MSSPQVATRVLPPIGSTAYCSFICLNSCASPVLCRFLLVGFRFLLVGFRFLFVGFLFIASPGTHCCADSDPARSLDCLAVVHCELALGAASHLHATPVFLHLGD